MDVYDTYYAVNRRLMTVIGIWPFQDPKEQIPRQVFVMILIISAIITYVLPFFALELTLGTVVEQLTALIPTLSFSSAYIGAILYFDVIKYTLEQITYDWVHISSLEELKIMKSYANQTRLYTLIFAAVMYGSVFFILSPTLLYTFLGTVGLMNSTETKELPVPMEYFLDKKKYFYIMLVHQFLTVIVLFTCAIAVYMMFFLVVQHACSVFRIISLPNNTEKWVYNCIYRYTTATEFITKINDCVEMAYLGQIALSMILVSLSILHAFQIRNEFNGFVDLLYNCSCIPGPIVCTYITCYVGQKLIDHSGDVFQTACQLSYYQSTQKIQKLLLFLLMRTSKPCSLSIGKLFVSSHEFFTATMQTSFSYAMVVYTFK